MSTRFIVSLILLGVSFGRAQDVQVQIATQKSPHYVGVGAIVQLTVEGLESDPEPKCTIESTSPEIRARLIGISPRIMQQMFRSGNQIRRSEQVTHTIQFRVTASKPGAYEIGPFVISQNGIQKRVDAITMSFQQVPTTDDMRIKLIMPTTAYPDQRVPVKVEWWFAGDTENVNRLNIDTELFDDFRFAPDPPAPRRGTQIPIQTRQGEVSLAASARVQTDGGKDFTVVSAERTLIPSRPGTYEIAPITATIELVTQWQRRRRSAFDDFGFGGSLFEQAFGGGQRPAKVELFRAEGQPITFEVKPFPNQGRPDSFSGAVGRGFSLDVAADRTVVRVGDPIRLKLTLRGDGNIEGAVLPKLSADGGLDPQRFRLPDDDVAGAFDRDRGVKQFDVSVRVLDETVGEIPAIAYSWFDAEQETYRTTRSSPIALRVMPAQVVGADSVVSARPSAPADRPRANPDQEAPPSVAGAARSFSLSGADLAIERDPNRLLIGSTTRLLARPSFQFAGYALGMLCFLVALVDYRRRHVDPAIQKATRIAQVTRNRVSKAARLPEQEAAREIADALRVAAAELPGADRTEIDEIMARCESIAYKPRGSSEGTVAQELVDRALAAASNLNVSDGAA